MEVPWEWRSLRVIQPRKCGYLFVVVRSCALFVAAEPGSVVTVAFDVKSGAGRPLAPHQVFVRLSHSSSPSAAVFVAHSDGQGNYKVTLDTSNRDALRSLTTGV